MALTQVSTGGIKDATIATADIAADAVTGAKIADDAVGAEHIEQLDADLSFADSVKAKFGAGNDLEIYHDGSDSYIVDSGTGDLMIRSTDDLKLQNADGSESFLHCNDGGDVILYRAGSERLRTVTDGFKVKYSDDSGATTLKLENNSTHNSQNPKVKIAVDLASGKDGGSIEFIRGNNYQSSAAADSEIVISPTKNDTNTEIVRITQDWFRLHSNCSGIQFNSDTASANALNDYEEGTFTPVMKFGGGNTGMSIGNVEAIYTKIGRMVFATIRFTMSGKGSSTGQLTFEGLPHTVGDELSTTSVQGGFPLQYSQAGYGALHEVMAYPWENTTVLKVFKRANPDDATADFTDSDISSTFDGRISFFYTANN